LSIVAIGILIFRL